MACGRKALPLARRASSAVSPAGQGAPLICLRSAWLFRVSVMRSFGGTVSFASQITSHRQAFSERDPCEIIPTLAYLFVCSESRTHLAKLEVPASTRLPGTDRLAYASAFPRAPRQLTAACIIGLWVYPTSPGAENHGKKMRTLNPAKSPEQSRRVRTERKLQTQNTSGYPGNFLCALLYFISRDASRKNGRTRRLF